MKHYFVILTVFLTILIISFYINGSKKYRFFENFNKNWKNFDLQPFDNFKYFNNISKLESGLCQPYIVSPVQADILELIEPIWFSCNSPMGKFASFSNDGVLVISERVPETSRCVYTGIIAFGYHPINGTVVRASRNEITLQPGIPTTIKSLKEFVVFCRDLDKNGYHFFNKTFFNFAWNQNFSENSAENQAANSYSLTILSVSGMSHNQAMRHLKKSLKFQAENQFFSFSMFGQKSTNNYLNSKTSFNEIWRSWKQKHPRNPTFLHTDFRNYSAESSRLFEYFQWDFQPHLYKQYNWQFHEPVENCITDGSEIIEDDVTLWKNFSQTFSKTAHFSLLHLTEIATWQDGRLANFDEILKNSLEELLEIAGISENSNIVILSDGGNRESEIYKKSETGKLEADYGFLTIRLAEKFQKNFPKLSDHLKSLTDRFTTNENVAEIFQALVSPEQFSYGFLSLSENCEQSKTAPNAESSCICSEKVEFSEEKSIQIIQKLEKLIKSEISTQKCLANFSIEKSIEFRRFRNLIFFKFHVALTTGTVKLQNDAGEKRNLKSKTFNYYGKAQFQENCIESMEILQSLQPSAQNDNTVPLERICSENYYHKIHVDFQNS